MIKHKSVQLITLLLVGLSLVSCSRKKNKWLNRNFHAMGAYYNIIYNGNLALEEGKQEIAQTYVDDYWKILPVERLEIIEASEKDEQAKNQHFERAEEKAAKAIQKHNMHIAGTEYNPQMDKAFILLGKARYYDQRFFPALEAFNYIITDYPESDQLATARIWREKTNMRMGNHETAIKNIEALLSSGITFSEEDYTHAYATLAQAYLNLEQEEQALAAIENAAAYAKSHADQGRYLFIKGQLHKSLNQIDSANAAFDRVIALNRKSPREYMINAYMQQIQNLDFTQQDTLATMELLNELAENRENRPYLDRIYYQFAEVYRQKDTLPAAVDFYNKSLREDSRDKYLVSRNYLNLAVINFDAAQYKTAGKYYDSTLVQLDKSTREYRSILKKRENLDDVILYEDIAVKNDSILRIAGMSDQEQLTFFTDFTQKQKEKAIAQAKQQLKEKNAQPKDLFKTQASMVSNRRGLGGGASFYFYDNNQVQKGIQKFKKQWGDIPLVDNWRYEDVKQAKKESKKQQEEAIFEAIEEDPIYQPETYISQIPQDQEVLDSLAKDRNFAYYQLGVIYKEKFKEYQLAANKLEALLKNNPEERLILPSKYNLYKIYEITGNAQRQRFWKEDILANHPDSRYATILRNPQGLIGDQNSPQAVYKQLYLAYQNEEFDGLIAQIQQEIELFTGNDIVPKLELLKAYVQARVNGLSAYKKALNYLALTYPQSEEGKTAENLLQTAIPALEQKQFDFKRADTHYKIVFVFNTQEEQALTTLKEQLLAGIDHLQASDLSVSEDPYIPGQQFLVVHGLKSEQGALGFLEKLKKETDLTYDRQPYSVAAKNYKLIQMKKNFDIYLEKLN